MVHFLSNKPRVKSSVFIIFSFFLVMVAPGYLWGEEPQPIIINADRTEFLQKENKALISGNVEIIRGNTILTCDEAELDKSTGIARAKGNVILRSPQGTISGDKMTYNFDKMTGDFSGTKITAAPYYGSGETIEKINENLMVMKKGYLTTCDLIDPHFKLNTQKADIYPAKKVVARNMTMTVGKVPLLFIPRYSQVLSDKKPRVQYTPGYDKQWGAFLLQSWRYYFSEDFKGTVHLDYRERKDFASGVDLDYRVPNGGKGLIRTYYTLERPIASRHFWQERPSPTPEYERFKGEWRHKWDIDDRTTATWQYYKLSDSTFLKDYFEREYEKDREPPTFFVLTKGLEHGTLGLRNDVRVNKFMGAIDRLPELTYDISSQELGDSGVYLKNKTTFSNLVYRDPSPTEVRRKTMRVDVDNELSYPFKLTIFELRPFVGGRETYYSRAKDPKDYHSLRGMFRTGADLSTKFYRVFDTTSQWMGIEINKLRHIITPSTSYLFTTDPSIASDKFNAFDGIDTLSRSHSLTFSLDNKLQTKRGGENVDLFRSIVSTDFFLKENPGTGGFNSVRTDFEINPVSWLTFNSDTDYSSPRDKLLSSNFDIYIHDPKKKRWAFGLGKRYTLNVDDQITTDWQYILNPKWKIGAYNRFDIDHGIHKEQEYSLTRDLHCWEMEINFNETRGEGSEIWLVFTLKAFPDLMLDFGTSFNRRKAGSQSSE